MSSQYGKYQNWPVGAEASLLWLFHRIPHPAMGPLHSAQQSPVLHKETTKHPHKEMMEHDNHRDVVILFCPRKITTLPHFESQRYQIYYLEEVPGGNSDYFPPPPQK